MRHAPHTITTRPALARVCQLVAASLLSSTASFPAPALADQSVGDASRGVAAGTDRDAKALRKFESASTAYAAAVLDFSKRSPFINDREAAERTRRSMRLLASAIAALPTRAVDTSKASMRIRVHANRINPSRPKSLLRPAKEALTIAATTLGAVAQHTVASRDFERQIAQLDRDIAEIDPTLPARVERRAVVTALLSAMDALSAFQQPEP